VGSWQGRLGVAEFAISGTELDTGRIVAARVAVLDQDGSEVVRWDWGSDRTDGIVGEVAQTLRTLFVLGIPLAIFDAAAGLTVLDRECRRRGIPALSDPAPVLDPLLIDHLIEPEFEGTRALSAMAERYAVEPGSLAAGRLVLAMAGHDEFTGTAAALHARQRGMVDGWPVAPLHDESAIVDTQPIPAPAPRPSDTVPMFDFSAGGVLAIEGPVAVEPPVQQDVVWSVEPDPEPPIVLDPAPAAPRRIHVAAAIVTDTTGRAVVVRKRGTTGFMQPGGKIEKGESALACLIRELEEELGLVVDVDETEFLGSYEAAALNEPGQTVRAEVFAMTTDRELHPGGEIDALHWLESPDDTDSVELAPLTLEVMLPLWSARRPALF
jgi:8-oxo-dGTP pyrophosphatase MutT (NUDIX family)